MMNTDRKKCGAPMPDDTPEMRSGFLAKFMTMAYRCRHCGKWNDLKRRKGWKEPKAQTTEGDRTQTTDQKKGAA